MVSVPCAGEKCASSSDWTVGESARDEDITAAASTRTHTCTQQELMGQSTECFRTGVLSREWRSSVTPMTQSACWLLAHELADLRSISMRLRLVRPKSPSSDGRTGACDSGRCRLP